MSALQWGAKPGVSVAWKGSKAEGADIGLVVLRKREGNTSFRNFLKKKPVSELTAASVRGAVMGCCSPPKISGLTCEPELHSNNISIYNTLFLDIAKRLTPAFRHC